MSKCQISPAQSIARLPSYNISQLRNAQLIVSAGLRKIQFKS
jgi:hypothetical protein